MKSIVLTIIISAASVCLYGQRIAIIDCFAYKYMDLDNDGKPDISHGNLLLRFLEEGLPDAEIVKYDIDKHGTYLVTMFYRIFYVEKELAKLISNIENGEKYDALNFSWQILHSYKDNLTPENLLDKRDAIRKELTKDNSTHSGRVKISTEKLYIHDRKINFIGRKCLYLRRQLQKQCI